MSIGGISLATPTAAEVRYPDSDGQPLGETDFHISAILYLREALRWVFRRTADTYVAANMLLYYEQGNPQAVRAPDVFAVKGVSKRQRRTYKLWEEAAAPCTIIEITSSSSRLEDMGTKRGLYEMWGVAEYLLFDPLGEYLSPRFQVFVLRDGYYQRAALQADGGFWSAELGVVFRPVEEMLRVLEPETGKIVPGLGEAVELAVDQAAIAHCESERASREAERASREAERASREAERASREAERASREAEHAKREAEHAHREAEHAGREAARAALAEAEVERLRAELARLRGASQDH
ncbi:MAG: Uma2 family endonuclease [Candidatus Schekmanbacteria bacterium]|nr:Uma2 family endonuclease [Candidatus Schekmanbacteria bacterium]